MCALFLTLDPTKPGPMLMGMREIVRKQVGPSGKENHLCQGTEAGSDESVGETRV